MRIAEFSVKNYQFTLIVFALVLAIGVNSLVNMPRGEDPETDQPSFSIVVVYPGTGPADMEKLVVDPMEKRINELDNLKRVTTSISDGLAVFRVDYKHESDLDEKYQEIVREVDGLRQELPQDIYAINVQRFSSTDVNILQLALISETASYRELEEKVETLEDRLEKVKSLKKIETFGFPEQEVRVSLNIEKMALNKIPVNVVLGALQSENANIPGGRIQMNTRNFNIKTSGDYKSVDEIKNTIVYSANGKILYLKDVADVASGYEPESHITRLNGHRAVLLTASQKAGQNIFKVDDAVKPVLEQFEKE
ncbi:MAG: efflux RND transporter permease subunit, partial [Flammeovirgaceae bacterium]